MIYFMVTPQKMIKMQVPNSESEGVLPLVVTRYPNAKNRNDYSFNNREIYQIILQEEFENEYFKNLELIINL